MRSSSTFSVSRKARSAGCTTPASSPARTPEGGAATTPEPNLVIREPLIDDLDALTRLVAALNRHQGDPTEHMTRGRLMVELFGPDPWFEALLAVKQHRPVGYAFFHRSYETGFAARGYYLQDLFVVADLRRRGVGRALFAAVARRARARGAAYVWWASKTWNREAQAMYARLGGVSEPVVAHAVFGRAYHELADQGQIDEEPQR